MTYRSTMQRRPWLTGAAYDKYNTTNAAHIDLYAYTDANDSMYFKVSASERGKALIWERVLRYEPLFDVWAELSSLPLGLAPARWTRKAHGAFRRAHPRLLAMCETPRGYAVRHVLCHYVKPYDADPWPRGTLNTYSAPVYREGRSPGRPKGARVVPPHERTVTNTPLDVLAEL